MQYECEFCGHQSESASVIIDCERRCEADDKNTRDWFSNYNPHRRD